MVLPFEKRKPERIVLQEEESDPSYGSDPYTRPVKELGEYGIINVNKPKGPTSHQVSAFVQQILAIQKSGHSGTLDPKVTGTLPIAIGRGTRAVQTILTAGKEYICLMHVHGEVHMQRVTDVMKHKFVGKIQQMPPVKSAVKRELRWREIYDLEILEVNERDVLFRVACESGTYIRKLCADIGHAVKTGAHMAELVRTQAGPFRLETSVTLQELRDAWWYYNNEKNETFLRRCIRPIEESVAHLRKIWVRDTAVDSICHGADLAIPGVTKIHDGIQKEEQVALLTGKGELVALATARIASTHMQSEKRGVVAKTKKVFMLPGIYPSIKK